MGKTIKPNVKVEHWAGGVERYADLGCGHFHISLTREDLEHLK